MLYCKWKFFHKVTDFVCFFNLSQEIFLKFSKDFLWLRFSFYFTFLNLGRDKIYLTIRFPMPRLQQQLWQNTINKTIIIPCRRWKKKLVIGVIRDDFWCNFPLTDQYSRIFFVKQVITSIENCFYTILSGISGI